MCRGGRADGGRVVTNRVESETLNRRHGVLVFGRGRATGQMGNVGQ